jgi:hypothetical protein
MSFIKTTLAAALAALAAAPPALWAQAPRPRATGAPAPRAATSSVAGSMSQATLPPAQRLAAVLSQIGLTACAPAVLRAGGFLFESGEANFVVQPLGPDPNRWPTVIMIEGAHPALGTTRLTTLTVTPGPTCTGFYQQMIWWPQPCDDLKKTVFADFRPTGVLLRRVQVSELGPGVQLYLTPAGPTGCVSEKKELFR